MAKETSKSASRVGVVRKDIKVEFPKLPADYRESLYGNRVTISVTAQEIFLDLFQIGPETGGRGEARIVFMGRLIFPLILAKSLAAQLQGIVESFEKDTGIELPGLEEMV